ncbi:MAG TPA: pitrilysin family protein [Symbiobacteriaceae bacterium]|nr:pitrilysin family protein [Symbiobacteriaceae bacterium]
MSFYQKTTLPGGLRVITESIPHVRSASVGIWVAAGSCGEAPRVAGISHFIEHMLFKGTKNRTAKQIAQAIDGRGGSLNAFTSKEHTCYYAKVLDEHLPVAIDVLSDMVLNSLFDAGEIEKEKGVIIEEIKMYEDVPDDIVHDLFTAAMWPGQALGRPIVGTADTVQPLTREGILAYRDAHYIAPNIVVAAAGNLSHDQVVAEVQRAFSGLAGSGGACAERCDDDPVRPDLSRAIVRVKDTEQVHLVVGMRGLHHDHDELYALHLINTVLGGGASSRLFQEIREERGLAYSVYSYQSSFRRTGDFGVYAGVSPAVLDQVLDLVLKAYEQVGREGLAEAELNEAKEQLKGQIMLGLESTSGRMTRLGRGELMLGRVLSPDQIMDRINRVTADEVAALARRLFLEESRVLSVVGPVAEGFDPHSFGFREVQHG